MKAETGVEKLPLPRPSFIELKDDAFICDPRLKSGEPGLMGRNQLLAMTPEERLQWHEVWRQFIRQCEREGWTAEKIAAAVWGETQVDESH